MLSRKELNNATRANIKKEMAKPRMAKSVRTAELNLEAERSGKDHAARKRSQNHRASTYDPTGKGTDYRGRADDRYRDLRIENSLTDGDGNEGRLKKGAHVKVTVTAKPKK